MAERALPFAEEAVTGLSQGLTRRGHLQRHGGHSTALYEARPLDGVSKCVCQYDNRISDILGRLHTEIHEADRTSLPELDHLERELLLASPEVEVNGAAGGCTLFHDLHQAGPQVPLPLEEAGGRPNDPVPCVGARSCHPNYYMWVDRHMLNTILDPVHPGIQECRRSRAGAEE